MFFGCVSLTTIPELVTSKGISFSGMFVDCSVVTTIPLLDTSNGTHFDDMFNGCSSLPTIPELVTSKGTIFDDMFYGCSKLTSAELQGCKYSVSLTDCKFDATALNKFFTALGTADGDQTINVTNNPGAATCDQTIVTAKGWTVKTN